MLYSQELFANLLCLERKRCERSGERFGLGLISFKGALDASALGEALLSQIRATDILGWYREKSVLGIIFTTVNHTPPARLRAMLHEKMDAALRPVLSTEEKATILATIHIFPEDVCQALYPDMFASNKTLLFHVAKRIIDIAASITSILMLTPMLFGIAILIKLSSPGPVFYRQKRMGLWGKPFNFLKFRTMYANNDASIHKDYVTRLIHGDLEPSKTYKIKHDPRITPIGQRLRKYSLDELPQFINILRGEMSLVGPRPPIPYEMESYSIWHKRRVLEAKPGLTGLWQVQGRSRTTFDEMVRMDIQYIQHQCGWLDFKIVLRTPRAVITGNGAY